MTISSIKDLKVYNLSFELAMEVFNIATRFPKEEKYSLTSQIIRSSRSVSANIREGFAKRDYEQVFIKHLIDALGSSEETCTWLDFAHKCNYLEINEYNNIINKYKELGAMLYSLQKNWKKL